MKLIAMTCPHCGATLQIDASAINAVCDYCGSALMLDKEVQHVQYDDAEEAGYKFEKGRQRAQAETGMSNDSQNTVQYNQRPKTKRRTWLWVLGWIFVFPLPLTILLLRKNNMKPAIKYAIIAAAWLLYLLIGFAGGSDNSTESTTDQQTSSLVEESTQTSSGTDVQDNGISDEESSAVETDNADLLESDRDIIMRKGHPTYYGSVEQSHVIWDDVEQGRIHFADINYGYNDKPILSMDSYRNSDVIRQVIINFENFNEDIDLSIDEALKITASYMPYDIMDQYYVFSGSRFIVPDESHKDEPKYYIVSYRLTDAGSEAYYAKEHDYSGSIDVIIQASDGIVRNIDITFGTPKWMNFLSKNGYQEEEWSCDLYDYK